MDADVTNIYPVLYNSDKQTAVRLKVGRALKSALLEAQRSGAPLRLKVEHGLRPTDVKATFRIGSQTHTLVGQSSTGRVDALLFNDEAGACNAVASIVTTALHAQQKDITAIKSRMQATARQATVQRHSSRTVLLDAPIQLKASQRQPSTPTVKPSRPEHNSRVQSARNQCSPARQQGPSSKGAASLQARTRPSTAPAPARHAAAPRQQPQQSNTPPRGQQHQQQMQSNPGQASGRGGKEALPARSASAHAVLKRKTSSEQASQQWQSRKRQRVQEPQGSKPSASMSGQWHEFARSSSGHAQHHGRQQPPHEANRDSGMSRDHHARSSPHSSTQRAVMPANGNRDAGGRSRPVEARAYHYQQHQRSGGGQDDTRTLPSMNMQRTRDRPGRTASNRYSEQHTVSNTAKQRMQEERPAAAVATAAGDPGRRSAAIAASQLERKAQLRSNPQHQQYYELEEGEILDGLDDADGVERLHRSAQPARTHSAVGTASQRNSGSLPGRARSAGHVSARGESPSRQGGQMRPDQQKHRQSYNVNRGSRSPVFTGQQQNKPVNAASSPSKPVSRLARMSQPAPPASSKVVAPKPAGSAFANQAQPQRSQERVTAVPGMGTSKTAKSAGNPSRAVAANSAAHAVGACSTAQKPAEPERAVAVSSAVTKQSVDQRQPTDSNASSRLFVPGPVHTMTVSDHDPRQRSTTPESTYTSIQQNRTTDLGPPGYEAFVQRPPRSFQPITSQQQYIMYQQQYEEQLAMYNTLQLVIDANVRSVMAARKRSDAATAGSIEQRQAAADVEAVRQALKPATERYMQATQTLLTEVEELLAHINQWYGRTH